MSKINQTLLATLVSNLEGNVVADPEALQAVIEDYGDVVDANSPDAAYAADAGTTDAYAITLSPAPTAYFAGMVVRFKANTANTGAATLNVNALGAKTIKKNTTDDLGDNDIVANQIITVVYDGTNFQLIGASQNELKLHKAESAAKHITESGSNANGFYIRFDDGTQICYRNFGAATTDTGSYAVQGLTYYYHLRDWTLPAAFLSAPTVVASSSQNTDNIGLLHNMRAVSTSSVQCHVHSLVSFASFSLTGTRLIAIGRWK